MRRIRNHLTYANVTASFALFVALGGVAYATIPSSNGTIYGCYDPSGKPPFQLSIVDQPSECTSPAVLLPFSQRGDTGATGKVGPRGPAGARGPAGGVDFTTLTLEDAVVLMSFIVANDAHNDLKQTLQAMETSRREGRMNHAINTLVREGNLLRRRKGTVGAVLRALKTINGLIVTSPCVIHRAKPCR